MSDPYKKEEAKLNNLEKRKKPLSTSVVRFFFSFYSNGSVNSLYAESCENIGS